MHFDAGVRGDAPGGVDHRHLPHVAPVVGGEQALERIGSAPPRAHQVEAEGPVARIDERLRRDRAHARLRPRHARPDGERMGLDRDAHLPRRRIARDDRVGVDGAKGDGRVRGGERRGRKKEKEERSGGETAHGELLWRHDSRGRRISDSLVDLLYN